MLYCRYDHLYTCKVIKVGVKDLKTKGFREVIWVDTWNLCTRKDPQSKVLVTNTDFSQTLLQSLWTPPNRRFVLYVRHIGRRWGRLPDTDTKLGVPMECSVYYLNINRWTIFPSVKFLKRVYLKHPRPS